MVVVHTLRSFFQQHGVMWYSITGKDAVSSFSVNFWDSTKPVAVLYEARAKAFCDLEECGISFKIVLFGGWHER